MTHYDMSGSEDGQLRSPGDEQFMSGDEDHDADSLDIKPPQASVAHSRDSTGSRRKEKSVKERKHSKEKKHRERSGRERDRERDRAIVGIGGEAERRGGVERSREHRRDERSDLERYHQRTSGGSGGGGYVEREDGGGSREIMLNERRYQKHYEQRSSDDGGGGAGGVRRGGNHSYHPQAHQYHQQLHMQRQRQEYYERSEGYHHAGADYYSNRHQGYYNKHGGGGGGGGHVDVASFELQRERERRKYSYEQAKDAESLEQDLRSRLLSKRHKYVKNTDEAEESHYEPHPQRRSDTERNERERAKAERHKARREKQHESVIEVLDSPETVAETQQRRKHKRRQKEREEEDETVLAVTSAEKRKTPKDPELLARREKLLAAEREKEKRKESAREELAARRKLRRGHAEASNALSPSAVAASVTAGLNVVKRKKESEAAEEHARRKRAKQTARKHSDDDVEELNDDDTDEEDEEEEDGEDSELNAESESDSDSSGADSDKSYVRRKSKKKTVSRTDLQLEADHSDEELPLPESPLSIGELSKSPKHTRHKRKSKKSADVDDDAEERRLVRSPHSARSHSHSISRSRSHTHSRSRSRSPAHSGSRSRSLSDSAHRRRTRSRSGTRSPSNSHSRSASSHSRSRSRSRTHSKSGSRSRSRTRSEERDMHAHARRCDAADAKEAETGRRKTQNEGDESPARDDKGVPLPNYYPGVQGCRSVEEFQCLNRIEEGTYGVVYRAKDKRTNEIVALKRLKMEKEKEGFPITSLREINTLLKGQHPNIVTVREIVVGSNMDKIFIVMDYVEHDLKSLMETMKHRKQCFLPGEVKCLTQQLLRAVGHLHDNWILHRDLKTSNLLLSHKGILKVGDFGLAREYGSPLKKYTSLVVTLWYRAPELLLCSPEYSTPIDIWSVGCIYGEFLQMAPMFPGKTEIDELNKIFKELGTPNEKIWPGYKELPAFKNIISQNSQFAEYPISNLKKRFGEKTTELGISLLQGLLTYDPKQRLSADAALKHAFFKELPLPIDPSMFPTWPAKSELGARKALASSPKPPSGGSQFKQLGRDDIIAGGGGGANVSVIGTGKVVSGIITGNKKTAANTGFVLNAGIEQRQLAMGPGFSLKF